MQTKHNQAPISSKEQGKDTVILNEMKMNIEPNFDLENTNISVEEIKAEAVKLTKNFDAIPHDEVLKQLLGQLKKVNFRDLAGLTDETDKLQKKHFSVLSIEQILDVAQQNDWGLCRSNGFIFLYNGAYWRLFDSDEVKAFLGDAAESIGVEKFDARYHKFRDDLYKQFITVAHLPKPEQPHDMVLINLKNGTFEISPTKQKLRNPDRADFLTYQLPFEYNPNAKAPMFKDYLNKVQPNIERQNILAEYLAYVFIKPSTLKLEKALFLYGNGANGKSVFSDIVDKLLGADNVSHYSLGSITDENGYHRAKLAGKLVNYSSEMNGKLEASIFKQMVTGEPVEARLPYQEPFIMTDYAKLIFNCNELPKDTEQTHAFFRRFLIIPFDVTIPDDEQDKTLAQKIIDTELSGVFNWVLDGLKRLLAQKNFTNCESVKKQLEQYKKESDSVQMFLEDENYTKAVNDFKPLKDIYFDYKVYCNDNGDKACSLRTLADRLRRVGYVTEKKNFGQAVYIAKRA